MFLLKLVAVAALVLSGNYVQPKVSDVKYLRDHFITNLLEDNKERLSSKLTIDVEKSIDLKINAFINEINHESKSRSKRSTPNELLLNEKSMDVKILRGFEKRGIVPVNFPQDICMFKINGKSFAVGFRYGKSTKDHVTVENSLSIFQRNNGSFEKVHEYKSLYMTKIDCESANNEGYIAVLNTMYGEAMPFELSKHGSFVYRVTFDPKEDQVKVIKLFTFADTNQIGVKLASRDNEIFLIFSYQTESATPLEKCKVFKLSADTFNPLDTLPCQNAKVIEFFAVFHISMILVGNYRENNGTTNAFSSIMRYDLAKRRFVEHQKIYTNAITTGKYFYLDHQNQRQHFIFIGNSLEIDEFGVVNHDVLSVIYKWVDGYFIPLQTLNVTQVKAVSPILGKDNEFNLLISSNNNEVQIYYYDGWKFQESSIDFTGNTFGSGVVSIRSYDSIIENTTTIVIANEDAYGSRWNIYTPVYMKRTDSTQLKENILDWCHETFSKLDEFNVNESDEMLKSALSMIDDSNDRASFTGKVIIEGSKVDSVHTAHLNRKKSIFNETSVEKIKELAQRANKLERNVRKLREKVNFTKLTGRMRRQVIVDDGPLVDTLVITKHLNIEQINGKSVRDIVYKQNRRNSAMRKVIANEIAVKQELLVRNTIDGIEMSQNNILINGMDQNLNDVSLENINIKALDTLQVNDNAYDNFLMLLRRKVDRKIPNMIHQLNVDFLNVKEMLNGYNITDIFINSLKTVGYQSINSNMNIQNLYTNGIMFDRSMEVVSTVPVSHLVNIKDNKLVEIVQDIQFEKGVVANELYVEERINNINIRNMDLMVMRKRGLAEQIVTGEKTFRVVNLIEPIKLNGRIKSETLEKMNPVATIEKNLVLQGDFVIKGPVTISRNLNVSENILTSDNEHSLRKLVEKGLNLYTTTTSNNKFSFKDMVKVHNSFNAHSVNGKLVDTFVKSNFEGEQVIEGTKVFPNSLFVAQGTVQADTINDVDLRRLNQTTLKKNERVSQFVDGNIEFQNVHVAQVIAQTVTVGGKDVKIILNTAKPQSLQQLSAGIVKVKDMRASKMDHKIGAKIFDHDLNYLIDDAVTVDAFFEEPIAGKSFGHLKVNQLELAETNEWKSIISNFNNVIVEELNVTDSFEFKNVLQVGNLQVHGLINGIKVEDMTNNWLKLEGFQVFTAPQNFKNIKIDNNINLMSNMINQADYKKLLDDSIYIDTPLVLKSIEIEGVLDVKEDLLTSLINGETLLERLVLNNSVQPQTFSRIRIEKLATVNDLHYNSVNGINVKEFLEYFNGNSEGINLIVNGVVSLENANISSLNNVPLKELYEQAWLKNRPTILSGTNIKFIGENEAQNIFYIDILNGKDIDSIKANYLSRTKDQSITGNLNILGTLTASKSFHTNKIIVPKFIKIDDSTLLNMTHFENNILRHNREQHVAGNWMIQKLYLTGDHRGLINGLNIYTDVLHTGNFHTAIVTGHKKIKSLKTNNVITNHVNDIDIADWIKNSVKLNSTEGQTIDGHVAFKKPIRILNDLKVHGEVNGIDIQAENILTKSGDQVIKGDVTINNIPHEFDGFKQIFLEHLSLKNGNINGRNWNEFYANAFTKDTAVINSNKLMFDNELTVENLITENNIYGVDVKEFLKESSTNEKLMKFKENMEHLTKVGDDLMRSLIDTASEMSHFELHQTIPGQNIQNTVLFSFLDGKVTEYVLGIHDRFEDREMIKFNRWNPQDSLFYFDETITVLNYNSELYQLTQLYKIIFNGAESLFLELIDKERNNAFLQVILQYDPQIRTFTPATSWNSESSIKVFTWRDGSMPCYGAIQQSFENIAINCINKEQTTLKTRPIRHICSENNIIVFANDEDKVQVWYEDKFYTIPSVINPASFACITYKEKLYLAIRSDKADETVHRGEINIFVSNINDMKFEHLQKLALNIPTNVQFSKAPSGDLFLYAISRDTRKALNIFAYAGSSNFVEVISESTVITEADDLDVIQINGKTEVLAVATNTNVYVLQSTVVQY